MVREAASVILVRPRRGSGEVEVFLLRRHRKASFMSSAFVFPGGVADPGEDDPRQTAARELFEEAGVLLADGPSAADRRAAWRQALHEDQARLEALLATENLSLDLSALRYFAHWITPSAERKRFSARFYLAALPEGQTPSFDNRETVDETWVTPAEALASAGELRLPPPQVRTFWELLPAAGNLEALWAAAAERARHPHPILPRLCPTAGGVTLLLPWDPEYERAGVGDARPMPADHPLAIGPSRFVLEEMTWKNVAAPTSTPAD
jgi:8-oxo-dGTP pyrophosphatase MutT (NUDIX family)